MPYKTFKDKKGYAMTSLETGKTYHYKTAAARKKAMKIHEMFKNMPKSKIRIAKKIKKKKK